MIFINKRREMEIFPESVRKLWNEWELRVLVLLSLYLQIVLILLGNRRKYIARNWIIVIVWLVYLSADWIAALSLGVLSNSQGDGEDKSAQANNMVWAFWAPFLLLHLGGPDTITAYSLEDNELWLRHLLGLFIQFGVAFYIFLRSWEGQALNILAIPMFVVGLIKYGERIWVLRSASSNHFSEAMLPLPDQEPSVINDPIQPRNDDAAILQQAYHMFDIFKRLSADLILSSQDEEHSLSFFQKASSEEAFRAIEIELGFMYDSLYTKASVNYSGWGCLFRFTTISLTTSTLIALLVINTQDYPITDVLISCSLLVGAIAMEMYALIVLLPSDWTMLWLSKKETPPQRLVSLIYRALFCSRLRSPLSALLPANKRWSGSVAQSNLISLCLRKRPIYCSRLLNFFGISDVLEKHQGEMSNADLLDLKGLIFEQLKSASATDIMACKKLCARRGEGALEKMNCRDQVGWSIEVEFDDSVLLWHIATDLCYYLDQDKNPNSDPRSKCESSKMLPDYMLYVYKTFPFMLQDRIAETKFGDTLAEAVLFFMRARDIRSRAEGCARLLQVSTEIPPLAVKGDRSKSVLFDACRLAKFLQSLETEEQWSREQKWELISCVWVEMLCYAANQCAWSYHAKGLTLGGELITHVWLLMAHLGITDHFTVSQGPANVQLLVRS